MRKENYKGYPDPSSVVSVEEASGLVGKRGVVFVDTRNYWKYAKGHIPGAVNLELYAFHWVDTSAAGVSAFVGEMAKLFGALGIARETSVVFYENNSGYDAARGVWLLRLMGNAKGRLLDGGLNLWRRRRMETSSEAPVYRRADFHPRVEKEVLCDLPELRRYVADAHGTILDCRSPGEFDGSHRRALKLGHIPGSLNIEWKRSLRRDGTLKDAHQLSQLYRDLDQERGVVTYCQSGYRAAHSWLVLSLLGFEGLSNYLGSWYEWGNAGETEAER